MCPSRVVGQNADPRALGEVVIARSVIEAWGGVLVALSLVVGGAAVAQPTLPSDAPETPPAASTNWAIHLGPGILWTPKFEGARARSVVPIPVVDLRYKQDLFFVSVRDGVGSTLLTLDGFRAGPILRLNGGRGEGASVHLRGLGGVPLTIEGGAFAKYDFGRHAGARIEIRRGLGGHNGWLVDVGADVRARLGAVGFSAGPRMSIADGSYNRAFFGVDEVQSARSGYARYEPGFGVRNVGASASAVWNVTDSLTTIALLSYGRLVGPAGESPIVNGPGGRRDQLTIGSAVTYRFAW